MLPTRMQEPGFRSGRAGNRGHGRETGSSLPPISQIAGHKDAPRPKHGRSASMGPPGERHGQALPPLARGITSAPNMRPPPAMPEERRRATGRGSVDGRAPGRARYEQAATPQKKGHGPSRKHSDAQLSPPAPCDAVQHSKRSLSRPRLEPLETLELLARSRRTPSADRPPLPTPRRTTQLEPLGNLPPRLETFPKDPPNVARPRPSSAVRRAQNNQSQVASRQQSATASGQVATAKRSDSPPIPTMAASPPLVMSQFPGDLDEGGGAPLQLLQCPHCPRRFNPEAHAKHVQVCMKVFQQHRKEFNSVAHRVPQEALQMLQHNKKGKRGAVASASTQAKPANKWRQKSEAFRAAIRDSRVVDKYVKRGVPLSKLPPPQQTAPELDDRVPCPHCGRKFGQQQAERHIPACKNTKAKPTGILRAGGPKPKAKSRS